MFLLFFLSCFIVVILVSYVVSCGPHAVLLILLLIRSLWQVTDPVHYLISRRISSVPLWQLRVNEGRCLLSLLFLAWLARALWRATRIQFFEIFHHAGSWFVWVGLSWLVSSEELLLEVLLRLLRVVVVLLTLSVPISFNLMSEIDLGWTSKLGMTRGVTSDLLGLLLRQHIGFLCALHFKLSIARVAQVTKAYTVSLSIVIARLHVAVRWWDLWLLSYELAHAALVILGVAYNWNSLLSKLLATAWDKWCALNLLLLLLLVSLSQTLHRSNLVLLVSISTWSIILLCGYTHRHGIVRGYTWLSVNLSLIALLFYPPLLLHGSIPVKLLLLRWLFFLRLRCYNLLIICDAPHRFVIIIEFLVQCCFWLNTWLRLVDLRLLHVKVRPCLLELSPVLTGLL